MIVWIFFLFGGWVSEVVRGTLKTRCAHYYCEIYRMQYNKFLIFIVSCIFRHNFHLPRARVYLCLGISAR